MAGEVARVRKPRPEKQPEDLDPGDLVEFSMTVEVRPKRSGTVWIKGGGTTTVRPSETGVQTRERLTTFVMDGINTQVLEALT